MTNFIQSLLPLPSSSEMREWDTNAIQFGIPENMLMENSAHALLSFIKEEFCDLAGKNILIFMGNGNNGGDAAALARLLQAQKAYPLVLHLKKLSDLRNSAAWHANLALKDGVQFKLIADHTINTQLLWECCMAKFQALPKLIIDGLLGTGFKNSLREPFLSLIQSINHFSRSLKVPVLAIDSPSGLDCDLGTANPIAIEANWTICLAAAKKGMVLSQARQYTGNLFVKNIGMPANSKKPSRCRLIDGRLQLESISLPQNSFKNSYGHLLVIGGSFGITGAPHLAALAALRCGAGLVSVCAPARLEKEIKAGKPEIMLLPAGEANCAEWPENLDDQLAARIQKMSALVIGPGMGRSEKAKKFLEKLLLLPDRPASVIDADALVLLSQMPEMLACLSDQDIITPHPGEAAFLLNCSAREIQHDREESLVKLCSLSRAVVILKGANTLVSQKNQDFLIAPFDIPQMGIGGAGDVLSGCLGASLAQNAPISSTLEIAAKAVMKHICAGLICASKFPQRGCLATNLANNLAKTEKFLLGLPRTNLIRGQQPWP